MTLTRREINNGLAKIIYTKFANANIYLTKATEYKTGINFVVELSLFKNGKLRGLQENKARVTISMIKNLEREFNYDYQDEADILQSEIFNNSIPLGDRWVHVENTTVDLLDNMLVFTFEFNYYDDALENPQTDDPKSDPMKFLYTKKVVTI